MKSRTLLPIQSSAAPAAPVAKPKAHKADEKMSITTLRFKPQTLAAIKKAAIDRNQSMQELIEVALAEKFERDGDKVSGLRRP